MRRSPIPLVAALALVTAIALLRAAQAITAGVVDAEPVEEHRDLAYRFYDAVNAAIRTGDTRRVAGLVTPDYVDRIAVDAGPGAAGLQARLAALHMTHPDLEIVVADALVRRNLIVARLDVRGGEAGFLGLPLPGGPPPWGPIDVLRVEGGRVAERHGGSDAAPHLWPLWDARFDEPPIVADLALTRVTIAPGAALADVCNPGPALVVVESGTLQVAAVVSASPNPETVANARGREDDAGTQTVVLDPGDRFVLPVDDPYALRNPGTTPVVALVVVVFPPALSVDERATAALPAATSLSIAVLQHGVVPALGSSAYAGARGVSAQQLGGGPVNGLSLTPLRLGGGRVTLPPGADLSLPTSGSTSLLVVESGAGDVAITRGLAHTRHHRSARIVPLRVKDDPNLGQFAALTEGGSVFLPPESAGTLRNTGTQPLRALMISVETSATETAS